MKRCKSCDFFEANPVHWPDSFTGWGDCDNEKVFHDGSGWDDKTPDSALFQFHDSEGYGASFEVHEKFGCVAHKSRGIRRLFRSRSRTKDEAQTPYEQLDEVEPTAADLEKIKRAQALLKDWSEKNVAEAEKIEREKEPQKEILKKT